MIKEFKDEYSFLSNFYSSEISMGMCKYPSVEHAFQAAKTLVPQERLAVMSSETPGDAKRAGRRVTLRPDWEHVKISTMRGLVRQKFEDPELRAKLLATGDQELIEGNRWGDLFWGVDLDTKVGANWLGVILMELRAELLSNV